MYQLRGIYAYQVPQRIANDIDGVLLEPVTEDPGSYTNYPDKDAVNFLILSQSTVNDVLLYYPNVRWLQLLNMGFEKVDHDLIKARWHCVYKHEKHL